MKGILGFITGLIGGIAAGAVIFLLLAVIFRLPGGETAGVNAPADAAPPVAAEVVAPAEPAAAPAVQDSAAAAAPAVEAADPTIISAVPQAGQLQAFERNALPFNLPSNTRGLAVVLIVPPGLDISALSGQPITVAIDPATQADQIGIYRAMGFESLTLLTEETRNSVPKLGQIIGTMSGSVGVLDYAAGTADPANVTLALLLGEHGLAYITMQPGFGGILAEVREAGLPAISVGAHVPAAMDAGNARIALDRAALDVMQRGNQVVVVEMTDAMVPVIASWIDAPKPRGMMLAPVSAVMSRP